MDLQSVGDIPTKDLLLLIEVTARAAHRAVERRDKPIAATCIDQLRRYAEALTNCPDCPRL